jgi:hypothetical protein
MKTANIKTYEVMICGCVPDEEDRDWDWITVTAANAGDARLIAAQTVRPHLGTGRWI